MSKKWKNGLFVIVLLLLSAGVFCTMDTQAAKKRRENPPLWKFGKTKLRSAKGGLSHKTKKKPKQKTTWKLKKGTLTISGKGKMNFWAISDLKAKERRRVKKVVIKKGITTVSYSAFYRCKNLKKAVLPSTMKTIGECSFEGTALASLKIPKSVKKIEARALASTALTSLKIPKSVKRIEEYAFNSCYRLKKLTLPGDFKTNAKKGESVMLALDGKNLKVIFTTRVRKLSHFASFGAANFVLSKKDPKYRSIHGAVYTKDGKTLIRSPLGKRRLRIADGCEEFCLQSVLYGILGTDGLDYFCAVREIEIPASVKRIESAKYFSVSPEQSLMTLKVQKVTIRSKQLDGNSLLALVRDLNISPAEIMRQLPGQVSCKNGVYVTRDGVTLKQRAF